MNDFVGLLVFVLLLLGNAFFVGAEFAVMSARRSQIEPLADGGNKRAKVVLWAMENVSLMLACAQLGITVCSLLILNVAEPAIHGLLKFPFDFFGVPLSVSGVVSFVFALVFVSFLHVTIGEIVPKNMAVSASLQSVLLLGPPLVFVSRLFKPVIYVLNLCANAVLWLLKIEPKDEVSSTFTLEQVQNIVAESTREGLVDDGSGLLSGALDFSGRLVSEVMVSLDSLVTVSFDVTPAELERLVVGTGFSRFLVVDGGGFLCGYLHVKDVLCVDFVSYDVAVSGAKVRGLVNVGVGEDVEEVLVVMQRAGLHIACVVDGGGVVCGVVFLEDILEVLVGEVQDAMQRV